VHHQPAVVEAFQCLGQSGGSLEGVEVEDAAAPLRAEHARGLVGAGSGAGGDDQVVKPQGPAIDKGNGVVRCVDPVDVGDDEVDAVGQRGMARPLDLVWGVGAER